MFRKHYLLVYLFVIITDVLNKPSRMKPQIIDHLVSSLAVSRGKLKIKILNN